MSKREIVGLLSILGSPSEKTPEVLEGNVSFKSRLRIRAVYAWDNNNSGSNSYIIASPFKLGGLVVDDESVGHSYFGNAFDADYPLNPTGTAVPMSTYDYARFRVSGTVGNVPAANIPRVFGAVAALDQLAGISSILWGGNSIISSTDVPFDYTQIGVTYFHPAHQQANTIATTTGSNYVTVTNGQFWDQRIIGPAAFWLMRIETGADAGFYFVHHNDLANNRLYLRCLDGTPFSALGTASGLLATAAPGRRAYFNEVSVIPLSVGTLDTSGRYNPRSAAFAASGDVNLRGSFVLRLILDKTGSTEAESGTEKQGSYYVSLKPFTHGTGATGDASSDDGTVLNMALQSQYSAGFSPIGFQFLQGGPGVMVLDWEGQRVWAGYTNNSDQAGILHWRWKTTESPREIANYLGTAGHASFVTPSLVLGAGDSVLGGDIGTNRWVYMTVHHASGGNGGLIVIKPDLTTLQYKVSDGIPAPEVAGVVVDKTRNRVSLPSDVVTDGSNNVTATGTGDFTSADIGRAITLTGLGADNGTYLVSTVGGATTVGVTTLAGGGVTFTSQTGGDFVVGDRAYLFFANNTTGAGFINYMESEAPGTFLTRVVAMTNGADCNIRPATKNGQKQQISIDQATGDVYWLSGDTQQQINKYNVAANSHSLIAITDANLLSPAGGSPSNPGTPTLFSAIHVNSKFDHIWVGSTHGHFRIIKSTFAPGTIKRYYGNESTTYVNPTGFPRTSGTYSSGVNSTYVRAYWELPDGRMMSCLKGTATTTQDFAFYSVASDNWVWRNNLLSNQVNEMYNAVFDPYGTGFLLFPGASSSNTYPLILCSIDTDWQWDDSGQKWFPMEWVPGALPNKSVADTTAPNALSKPIHSGYEEVLWGVKVRWNRQGGATPANNEFIGRAGQARTTAADGSTSIGTATFGGSSFTVGDVGNLLRIESGADAGTYKITAYLSAASVTLANMNGTAFSAAATAGTLAYTVWELGTPGSNAGPENLTVLLADGYSKDNTQDISGMTYEQYLMKTTLHDNDESRKFVVPNPLAVPGATETKVYSEFYPRAAPQYDVGTSNHRALPGGETALARKLLDFTLQLECDGNLGTPSLYSSPSNANIWYGNLANSSVFGYSHMVDFGADVAVGYIQYKVQAFNAESYLGATATNAGSIANLYKASGAAPVASSVVRTAGVSNVSFAANGTTGTLSSGDFLGAVTTGPLSNGNIVATGSDLVAPASTFTAGDRGRVLKVTAGAGADNGAYRITVVSVDGSTVTVRNLDQTAKVWGVTAGSVTYEVRNGVQEEDMLALPSVGAPTHRLKVERLLTSTTVQVRTGPNAIQTNVSWDAVVPTWEHVKRVSYSTEAEPPEVKNNGTFVSGNGRDKLSNYDVRYYLDLTDLPVAQRTGRYWKLVNQPRFTGAYNDSHWPVTLEFYDVNGDRLGISKYSLLDEARTNADFLASNMGRIDFIQAAHDAVGVAGFNGVADLGGANGDTITMTNPGDKFLGFQVGPLKTDGALTVGTDLLDSASSSFQGSAALGRFVRIQSGVNAGSIYRIATRPSATQVTVTTVSGGAVSWGTGETSIQFSVHEGINAGGAAPDRIRFLSDGREFTLATVNNTLTTLTIEESLQATRTGETWEIVRPGFNSTSTTTEAAKTARLDHGVYPLQSGDCFDDYKGSYVFFSEDIGTGHQRADGVIAGGSGVVTGSGFTPDDVGRLLYIVSGTGTQANNGIYEISVFGSSSSVTVKNHYDGTAVSFTADGGPVTYKVYGDRRFRMSKFVIVLRQ